MRSLWLCLVVALQIGLLSPVSCAEEGTAYTTEDGKLLAKLSLRLAQGGFVGYNGTLTTVEPSGAWSVSSFVNNTVSEPHLKGKLSPAQLKEAQQLLAAQNPGGLPEELGSAGNANPAIWTLTVGEHSTKWTLSSGTTLEGFETKDAEQARFLAVARAIASWTKE